MAENIDPLPETKPLSTSDPIYRVARLTPSDGLELLAFRKEVIAGLENPDFLHEEVDEPRFVTRLLGRAALTLAILANARICAYTSIILPNTVDDLAEFGLGSSVATRESPRNMAYVAGTMVGTMARGRGFQNTLTKLRAGVLSELDRRNHFATAALGNHFSWRNALSNGFHVADLLEIDDPTHGRLVRLLLRRPENAPNFTSAITWVDATDAEQHRHLLSTGLVGTRFRLEAGVTQIGYQLKLA